MVENLPPMIVPPATGGRRDDFSGVEHEGIDWAERKGCSGAKYVSIGVVVSRDDFSGVEHEGIDWVERKGCSGAKYVSIGVVV
jgi:hypothetical protein